ncbi:hypothetical protein R1flu_011437 [Riccia fluitans]|uniref:DUF1995 domain-containing protein n=1 Tax=Riccia fluitans TaxID=41844 RepID=A0ABD1Z8N9_9MARC
MASAVSFCACSLASHVSSPDEGLGVRCIRSSVTYGRTSCRRRRDLQLDFWTLSNGDQLFRFNEDRKFAGVGKKRHDNKIFSMVVAGSGGELPPQSREETVEQAGSSLASLLEKALKAAGPTTVKQRKSLRQQRLRVDIPVLDESPQALFSLTLDLIEAFIGTKKVLGSVAVYFPSALLEVVPTDFVNVSKVHETRFISLESEEGCQYDTAVVLIVAADFTHARALDSIARSAGHRPVVVLNGGWSAEEESNQRWGSLLSSFEVAYAFTPLAIQGFFGTTEGAILKHVRSGAPSGRPWLIFVKEGDSYKCDICQEEEDFSCHSRNVGNSLWYTCK